MPRRRPKAPPDVLLRPATEADRDAIARIWWDGARSTGIIATELPGRAELRVRIDDELANGWQVTVADDAGTVIGFLALRPDQARLDQIFVAPDRQGEGIGRELFAAARAAMPAGFSLRTAADNARARRFYHALVPLRAESGLHPRRGYPVVTYGF